MSESPVDHLDLLGAVAYGELCAFTRLAADAERAPDLAGRAELATLAAVEIGHYRMLRDHLAARDVDVLAAMAPFVGPLDAFHARTAPRDWAESLVAAHLGRGVATDLQTLIADRWQGPPEEAKLVRAVAPDPGHDVFAEREVRALCEDPRTRDRLALWGRRLLGETLAAASTVLERHPEASAFIGTAGAAGSAGTAGTAGTAGSRAECDDDGGRAALFKSLKSAHGRRMQALGL